MKCILCNILTAGLLGVLVGTGCSSGYKVGDCVFDRTRQRDFKIISQLSEEVFETVDTFGITYTLIPTNIFNDIFKISCARFEEYKKNISERH